MHQISTYLYHINLNFKAFYVPDHYNILNEFQSKRSKWIKENKIKWKDTVYDGLENAPKAFIVLFKGGKMGETLVRSNINNVHKITKKWSNTLKWLVDKITKEKSMCYH